MDNWFLKFETKYDLSVLKKFNRYNLYSKPTTCITTVMALLLIVIGLLSGSFDVTYRLIFCCIGALWIIEMIFLPGIYAKSTIKTSKLNNTSTVEVTLDSNNISMITRKGDSVVSTNTPKKKSSSGLSAGAIAGIVVGAVVVLLGISIIAIICCRKSRQLPIDNTTAIDVKTTERIYI